MIGTLDRVASLTLDVGRGSVDIGLEFLHGDAVTRTALGIEIGDFLLTDGMVGATRGAFRFFSSDKLVQEAISKISPYKLNPTEPLSMSKREFKQFVQQVKENGITESLKYVEHDCEMYLVNGHHRLYAAKILGFDTVPIETVQLSYLGYTNVSDLFNFHP